MAFVMNGMCVEGTSAVLGSGPTAKYYRCAKYITDDAPAVVEAANYFNPAVSRLPVGTAIEAQMSVTGTPVYKEYVVTANDGATVTIALQKVTAG